MWCDVRSYVWREGRYVRVPASRADIFKDRSLSPVDKRALMRFLQKAQQSFLAQAITQVRKAVLIGALQLRYCFWVLGDRVRV